MQSYGGQVEHGLFHPGEPVAGDAEHLPARRHLPGQQHHVAVVHRHAVALHHLLDLVHDGGLGCLHAQGLVNLKQKICCSSTMSFLSTIRCHVLVSTVLLQAQL